MNLKILEQKDEPLLSRKDITAEVIFDSSVTPSNAEVKKNIASQTKSDEKLVVVKKIDAAFGATKAVVRAYVYTSEKEMTVIEPKDKKAEAAKAEAAKKEAAAKPAEEKKEAPKEEKKEEKKEEPKKE